MPRNPVLFGRLGRAHGLRGDLRAVAIGERPEHLRGLTAVILRGASVPDRPCRFLSVREDGAGFLVRIEGVEDRTGAEALAGCDILVDPSDLPKLEPGEFYRFQMLGLAVRTEEGEEIGVLEEIIETAGGGLLLVRGGGRERLIPNAAEFVISVDADAGLIIIRTIPGLLDLDL